MREEKDMSLQEILYKNYIKSLGDEVLEVVNKKPPKVGQVRLFLMTPPEWVLVIDKPEEDLFTIVPLTTYIRLALTNIYPPVVTWKHLRMVPLPFWVYVRREILEKYSKPVFRLRDIESIKEYVKKARTRGIGKWREKFIQKVADRFADINLSSLLYQVHLAEEEEQSEPVIVPFPADLKEVLEREKDLVLAAEPLKVARGDLWLAVKEGDGLLIYLAEECVGKPVRITLKDKVIYEGEGRERILIKDFPDLPSYQFLEGELNVQVLEN